MSDLLLRGLASLEAAGPDQLSFLGAARYVPVLERSRAGAVLVGADLQDRVPSGMVGLVVADPLASWAQAVALFHPAPAAEAGIHPSAVVAETAVIDPSAEIGALTHIGARAIIGARCRIGPGAVIGSGVVLGPDCRVGPNASISHAVLGARVYVYPGARIGQEGFGFSITPRGFLTTPQLCGVVLGDDVEVGANATIDRGALRDTEIGTGTRLDNHVQVAHGVRIGRYCAVAALAGISGSAEIGDFVVIGGQVGVAEHVTIASKARIGAQSGVMSALEPGAVVAGSPARPARQMFREVATLKRLAQRPRQAPETR
jgi:UDP-3-O-[3-hydroxymyristoyl] glucosamine N-acyltransferase